MWGQTLSTGCCASLCNSQWSGVGHTDCRSPGHARKGISRARQTSHCQQEWCMQLWHLPDVLLLRTWPMCHRCVCSKGRVSLKCIYFRGPLLKKQNKRFRPHQLCFQQGRPTAYQILCKLPSNSHSNKPSNILSNWHSNIHSKCAAWRQEYWNGKGPGGVLINISHCIEPSTCLMTSRATQIL